MNIDLWLVFLGGVLLSAVLPGAGAILALNHAFQRGWRKTLPLIAARLRPYFQSPETRKQQNRLFAGFLVFIAFSICFVEHPTLIQ
ncbi:hypothetical protein E05_50150 [Plautia stali symbiont]|nr:hypothetical protein E05_50150 [Plautia stali symbiont]